MKRKEYLVVLSLMLLHCSNDLIDFSIARTDYLGDDLRLDGYYYSKSSNPTRVLILYRNGVIIDAGTCSDLSELEEDFRSGLFYETMLKYYQYFGLFRIEGNTLNYEFRLVPDVAVNYLYSYSGNITSDTTFVIESYSGSDGERGSSLNRIYNFKHFSPKPDSTCPCIK